MHRADGHGGSRRCREDQTELARDVNNEELAQRSSEEETKVSRDSRKSDDDHVVVFGGGAQELELVHSRERGDENVGKTTGGHGSRLADVVLTRTEAAAQDRPALRNNLGKELDDGKTGDGLQICQSVMVNPVRELSTYTEQVGCEGPSRLQTQVDVGGIDEGTAAKTDEQSTDGKDVVGLIGKIVEGLEGIDGKVI